MTSGDSIADYPVRIVEKVRYSDTDRQGHVNNVAFAVFFEAGRVDLLFMRGHAPPEHCAYVLARSAIDFLGQLRWPGEVEIGTRIERLGTSSIVIRQALFQGGHCAAISDSVMVQVDVATQQAHPLGNEARAAFQTVALTGAE